VAYAASARADRPTPGVEVAAGAGMAMPFGSYTSQATVGNLGYTLSPGVAPTVDAGIRLDRLYFGTSFQYDFLLGSSGAFDYQLLGVIRYDLGPRDKWTPWIGAGLGLEVLGAGGNTFGGYSADGRAGVDFRSDVGDAFRYGPFFAVSFGELNCQQLDLGPPSFEASQTPAPPYCGSMHEWVTFGLRAAWDGLR